jgi:hypothetical protein
MPKVGGEVDALCTRCGMVLGHTVIAMVDGRPVKVECNTCHGVHRFRGESPGAVRPRSPEGKAERARPVVVGFDEELRTRNLAAARRYSPAATYALDDVVEHPTFGLGWVSAVREAKIEVTFRSDVKVLVHRKP